MSDSTTSPSLADLRGHAGREVAGAAGDVERRCPGRSPVCDSAKRFQSRCTPADIRSFIRSYLSATESNTSRTRRAFSLGRHLPVAEVHGAGRARGRGLGVCCAHEAAILRGRAGIGTHGGRPLHRRRQVPVSRLALPAAVLSLAHAAEVAAELPAMYRRGLRWRRETRDWFVVLMLLASTPAFLLPTGFMPAAVDGQSGIAMCRGTYPAPADHGGPHTGPGSPCPYAVFAGPAPPPAVPALHLAHAPPNTWRPLLGPGLPIAAPLRYAAPRGPPASA